MKKVIVFSGINITQGGPLTILQSFADYASSTLSAHYDVYFLVKDRRILKQPKIHVLEFPQSQKTILHKLYFEYFGLKKISKDLHAHLWFSLNDCTPNVSTQMQCVYFHNATPFYKISWMDLRFPSRVVLQKFYYYFFYRINIHRNSFIVVQQQFFKEWVHQKFNIANSKIILHRPAFTGGEHAWPAKTDRSITTFFYPTKAFVYKNVHIIIKALAHVKAKTDQPFKIILTISENDNKYSRWLKQEAAAHPEVSFVGYVPYDVLKQHYQDSDCVIFPSKLETWGLPLSEAMHFNKFVLAADLPYAHETIGDYDLVSYFDADDAEMLAEKMVSFMNDRHKIVGVQPQSEKESSTFEMEALFNKILFNN